MDDGTRFAFGGGILDWTAAVVMRGEGLAMDCESKLVCPLCGEMIEVVGDRWRCPSDCDLSDYAECMACCAVLVVVPRMYCDACEPVQGVDVAA